MNGKIKHANINQKETEVAVLTSDNADFRTKKITKDRGVHYDNKLFSTLRKQHKICMYETTEVKNICSKTDKMNREIDNYTLIVAVFILSLINW